MSESNNEIDDAFPGSDPAHVGRFIPGDRVYRTTSQHSEPGKIMCVFLADGRKPRYVFQYDRPKGLLHIAPEWQLTPESHGEQPLMVGEAVGAADATRGASDLPGNHV